MSLMHGYLVGLTLFMISSKWSKAIQAHMFRAEQLARNSICNSRHGCAIYRRNTPMGLGWNKDKTHPAAIACYSQCIHAELAAILSMSEEQLEGCDAYIARIMRSKNEALGMSRPCRICMQMFRRAKLRKIYYTNRSGNWTMEKI